MREERGGLLFGERVWFYDVRTPVRRMAISTHQVEAIAVISLWQGDTCTGTFRLPLAESACVIAALADGMAAGLYQAVPTPQRGGPGPRWSMWLRQLVRRPRPKVETRLWVVR